VPLKKMSLRRTAGMLAVSAALLVTAAACGSDDSSGGSSGGDGSGGGNNAFAAYTSCLRENGVTITMPSGGPREGGRPSDGARPSGMPSGQPRPSGSGGPGGAGGRPGGGGMGMQKPEGVDDATWEKAQTACASLRPSMGAGRGGDNRGGNSANAAYENCLKENGVTDVAKLDESDATVKKAVTTCSALKPSAAPGN
jgi:hypothetical protein